MSAEVEATPSLTELGHRAARLALVSEQFAAASEAARLELQTALLARYASEKLPSVETHADGRAAVGWTVKKPNPKGKIAIGDVDELTAFFEEHYPTEITWVHHPQLNAAFLKRLIGRAVHDAANGAVVDSATGHIVPGLIWEPPGEPTGITTSWKTGGKEAVFDGLRGDLAEMMAEVLGLPAGGAGPDEVAQ